MNKSDKSAIMATKFALQSNLFRLKDKIRLYSLGDRPSSPSTELWEELWHAQDDLVNYLESLPEEQWPEISEYWIEIVKLAFKHDPITTEYLLSKLTSECQISKTYNEKQDATRQALTHILQTIRLS